METSKTKKLTPHLMRTFSVLLDQIVDVTCPCTSADTLDAAPAANALDSTPLDLACKKDRSERLESRQWVPSVPEASTSIIARDRLGSADRRGQTDRKLDPEGRSSVKTPPCALRPATMSWKRKALPWAFQEWPPSLLHHRLSPSFGSARTRGARAAAQQLIDQRTFARTRHQPSCQKRNAPPAHQRRVPLLSRSKQRGLRPQRCTKKTFLRQQLHSPNSSCDLSSLPAGATAHCAIPTRASTTTPTTRPR